MDFQDEIAVSFNHGERERERGVELVLCLEISGHVGTWMSF